ncbi:hypothetical protein KC19_4G075500 [Ceratodon purpureus]|uniref:Uncharacterized protein n=1 Tax=Ceratodon purpureus TaxID=3225 RepID=A0A8T0I7S1_CERPU|nr:hypothetical protein KC19_4G075500 [Ceratodon purpureus]
MLEICSRPSCRSLQVSVSLNSRGGFRHSHKSVIGHILPVYTTHQKAHDEVQFWSSPTENDIQLHSVVHRFASSLSVSGVQNTNCVVHRVDTATQHRFRK